MKKINLITLIFIFCFGLINSFTVFADEKYPPIETGEHYTARELEGFSYETAGDNPEPITLSDSARIQIMRYSRILDLNDDILENQIKEDYVISVNNKVTADELVVQYFGALSDGSLLVYVDGPFSSSSVSNYRVIGKYVYVTSSSNNDIKLYKNNTFTRIIDAYQNGELSDELIDETAEILCFAKFVNPNGQSTVVETTVPETTNSTIEQTTHSTNIEETTVEATSVPASNETTSATLPNKASTTDTAINNSSNNSIQTGGNDISIVCVIVLIISGIIFYTSKYKKAQ